MTIPLASPNTTAALRSSIPVSFDQLERVIGKFSYDRLILEGLEATVLCSLPGCGVLVLSRTGDLIAVHASEDAAIALTRVFRGPAHEAWSAVAAAYPGIQPGKSCPRFWVCRERALAVWRAP